LIKRSWEGASQWWKKKNSPQRKTKTADEGPQLVVMQLREQFEG